MRLKVFIIGSFQRRTISKRNNLFEHDDKRKGKKTITENSRYLIT